MSKLSAAVAALCCVTFGQPAYALNRTEFLSAVKIYFAGPASADRTIEVAFLATVGGICDSTLGDVDIWRARDQFVITCRASNENSPNHGLLSRSHGGTMIAFHKESVIESAFSDVTQLIRVARGQAHVLRWLDVSQLTNDCTVTTVNQSSFLQGYINHSECGNTILTPYDTATSSVYDVHGTISGAEAQIAYPEPGADAGRVVSSYGYVTMFGVPVTTALYRALQAAQFGDGSPCDDSDLPSCVPSLTRSQLAGLYSQSVYDWNMFKNAAGVSLPSVQGVTPPSDPHVRICRGTAALDAQVVTGAYFLGERCMAGGTPFALPDDASTIEDITYRSPAFQSGTLVNASPSPSTVRSCLGAANQQNFWGIGVLPLEIVDTDWRATAGYRFIAIDGAAPTLVNLANGDYDFFSEAVISRVANTFPGNAGAIPDGNPRREVIEVLQERLRVDHRLFSHLNSVTDNRPWGNAGLLAPASANIGSFYTAPYSEQEVASTPIATQTRNGKICGPAIMSKPQPVNGTPNP